MDYADDDIDEYEEKLSALDSGVISSPKKVKQEDEKVVYANSILAPQTQKLIELLFSKTMFQEQMTRMELDTNKMPLGKNIYI
jgi:hypothetical protein